MKLVKVLAAVAGCALIVLGRQPHTQLPQVRITQWVVTQYLRLMFQRYHPTGVPGCSFYRHIIAPSIRDCQQPWEDNLPSSEAQAGFNRWCKPSQESNFTKSSTFATATGVIQLWQARTGTRRKVSSTIPVTELPARSQSMGA